MMLVVTDHMEIGINMIMKWKLVNIQTGKVVEIDGKKYQLKEFD
jgi:hypothetical protein